MAEITFKYEEEKEINFYLIQLIIIRINKINQIILFLIKAEDENIISIKINHSSAIAIRRQTKWRKKYFFFKKGRTRKWIQNSHTSTKKWRE